MSRLLLLGKLLKKRATLASLLAKYGSNAHAWLPGASGVSVSGLPTSNYLLSDGSTGFSSTDSVVGLALDGMGSVGGDIVVNPTTGWNRYDTSATISVANGLVRLTCNANGVNPQLAIKAVTTVIGNTYLFTCASMTKPAATTLFQLNATNSPDGTGAFTNGNYGTTGVAQTALPGQVIFKATATTTYIVLRADTNASGVIGQYSEFAIPTVREITGIPISQATTANKCLLKKDAGNRFYWQFDATDLLTSTFPAGYESVTVIDAKSTGQVTTSGANIVGSYSIGPSGNWYGRIIVKGAITAADLAQLQRLANQLAGL